MNTIMLAKPWTFRDMERTIDYEPGEHAVDDVVFAAAIAAGVAIKEAKSDGDGPAKAGAKGAAVKAEG